MPLGINLGFCVKRWVTPDLWAPLVREELGLDLVQLTFDLVDPLWPDALLDDVADGVRREAAAAGVTVHSAFIGLAHYTFNQLLHPEPRVRDFAEAWLLRAYRFAARAGIRRVGGPLGAVASRRDGHEAESLPEAEYQRLLGRMRRLSEAARAEGLEALYVEATPLRREWPWTVEQSARMMADVAGTPVPWQLCVDWGHAAFEPVYGASFARPEAWLAALSPHVGVLHLQQTDGQLDRHWDFTRSGVVDPAEVAAVLARTGLGATPMFLEVFYPFEQDDASVLQAVRRSCEVLRPHFPAVSPGPTPPGRRSAA